MKNKNIVTVLLVIFILTSCAPVAKAALTELPTSTSQSEVPATESTTSDWNTYTSELFLVTLKYPAYWEINNEGYAVYSGQDGFFQISSSSISGLTVKETCENVLKLIIQEKKTITGQIPQWKSYRWIINQPVWYCHQINSSVNG